MMGPATRCEAVELPTERMGPLDPAAGLASIRETSPVCPLRYPNGDAGWLVTSHALGRTVLADPRFCLEPVRPDPVEDPVRHAAWVDVLREERVLSGFTLMLDPPQQRRIRRALAGEYSMRRAAEHRELIERIVDECLEAMDDIGPPADFAAMFASPVAFRTHCALLGVSDADSEPLHRLVEVFDDLQASPDEVAEVTRGVCEYLQGVIDRKRAEPANDLASYVLASGDLDEDEIVGALFLVFIAGHDVLTNSFALSLFSLLSHPEQLAALRAGSASVDGAVDELLRYATTLQVGAFTRTAREDVELGGVLIRAGDPVTVSLSAGNRDPAKFSDPDRLDLNRGAAGHLAFGHGVHKCLGQHLARLELQVGIARLLERFPNLRLAVPDHEVPLHDGRLFLHGVHELPVAW